MADRFPSLEDFDSGGERLVQLRNQCICLLKPFLAQTDIKGPSADPSTDDFLAREKAVLGDDADQFASAQDASAFVETNDDDLLGGGEKSQSTFDSQFPDLAEPPAVSWEFNTAIFRTQANAHRQGYRHHTWR
jgi:hypothetical protein